MGQTLHIIAHTHWDREWYLSFECHRMKLVEFMDTLLETLGENPDFKSFHLDGQYIILEDYLEIKPFKLDVIKQYIDEGRLIAGPWYILQDEYLVSGEAQVRNLLYGIRKGRQYGLVGMIGYLPDAFDNISQMPQILNGFGIDNAIFGRGVFSSSKDLAVLEQLHAEGFRSEMIWRSPDGSEVLGIMFVNWYDNAIEIPTDPAEATHYLQYIKARLEPLAATPHLLLMNGCDHQPVQANLPQILAHVRPALPEDTVLHSNFPDYLAAVRPYRATFPVVEGELAAQRTTGYHLVNTASSRLYLKQLNHIAQNLLEKWAEPFGVCAWMLGDVYRKDFLDKAWRELLHNHPHDSICGCSVDDVHAEMVIRFKKSIAIAQELLHRACAYLASKIDTSAFPSEAIPVVVFNPFAWEVTEPVTMFVDMAEHDPVTVDGLSVEDPNGNAIAAQVAEVGRTFTYTLPADTFRKVTYVKRFAVTFNAEHVPGVGYKTFVVKKYAPQIPCAYTYSANSSENAFLRLDIQQNGSLLITHKATGQVFDRLNLFEDSGDIGDEYNYLAPVKNRIVTSEPGNATISIAEQGPAAITFKIELRLTLPMNADKSKSRRARRTRQMRIRSYVTMGAASRRIDIRTEFDNTICDHRLRALFPSRLNSNVCSADGQFDIVRRPIDPWAGWENPSNCQRQQAFVDIHDGQHGLVIANRGLPEYEVLRDGNNTIALTLVRSVAELGDWGYFPTPDAQCQGRQVTEYAIIPYGGTFTRSQALKQGYQFSGAPLKVVQATIHAGELGLEQSIFTITGDNLVLACLKRCEDRNTGILRVYNISDAVQNARIAIAGHVVSVYQTNLNEDRQRKLNIRDGAIGLSVPPRKILTIEFEV